MTNGGSVHLLWMAMLMGGCGGAPEPEAPVSAAPERTSVLLVVVDTLRADHTTPYGHDRPTTPFFSSLASQSIVYERAYSTAPWTKPSIAALLTSRYPTQLGLVGHPPSVPDKATLLAEHFSAAGYATGAVVSHTYVGSKYGFQQGFDTFDESQVAGHVGATAKGVTDTAIAWLDEHGEGPFFLLAHYFDPHFAYLEREGFPFSKSEGYDGPIRSAIPYGKMRKLRQDAQAREGQAR
jgi:arylsulfatase A-like enzyme